MNLEERQAKDKQVRAQATRDAIDAQIERIAASEGVDPDIIRAIVKRESNYNPRAVSAKGAGGLMQLMPATAAELGLTPNDRFDPEKNLTAGIKYFKKMLMKQGGDEKLALAAYNAGPGAVKKYKGVPPYKETLKYIDVIQNNTTALRAARTDKFMAAPSSADMPLVPEQAMQPTKQASDMTSPSEGASVSTATFSRPEAALAEGPLDSAAPTVGATSAAVAPKVAGAATSAQPGANDAMIQKLLGSILGPHDSASPIAKPLDMAQRAAAGLLAALDPEGYKNIVLPELERRGADAKTLAVFQEASRTRDISALQAIVSMQERGDIAGARLEETSRTNDIRQQVADQREEARQQQLDAAQQYIQTVSTDVQDLASEMTPIIQRFASTGSAAKLAAAESLGRQVSGVSAMIDGFANNLDSVSPQTPQLIERQITSVRALRDKMIQGEMDEAKARLSATRKMAGTLIKKRVQVTDYLSQAKDALKLATEGAGGWFAGGLLPQTDMLPGGQARLDLNAIYAIIQPERIKEVFGSQLTERELLHIEGAHLDIADSASKQMVAINKIIHVFNLELKSIDAQFRGMGVNPENEVFGYDEHPVVDELEDESTMTHSSGAQVYQFGNSPMDYFMVEGED